jgi:predicted O-methyltransferase YrrM
VSRCRSTEDLVQVSFNVFASFPLNLFGWTLRPNQIKEEIIRLLEILAFQKPQNVLEVGTASGGTLCLFSRFADPRALLVSIDLPGGSFGGGYPEWKAGYYKSFASPQQQIHLIRGNSHSAHTLNIVKALLNGDELDFLFIDGDHTYEGVKSDFETYGDLVRNNGLIALHDIVPGPATSVGGVPQFWNQIKHDFEHTEFVKDWKQNGFGIGVLHVQRAPR